MKIGLLSDTHGHFDEKIYQYFQQCDEIWHAGDIGNVELYNQLCDFKPVKAVFGNIDNHEIRAVCPEWHQFNCEGLEIWMTHIGGYPPKYNRKVYSKLQKHNPDIFICGHSHILKVMTDPRLNNLLFLNPGAAGKHGFHKVKTVIRFEINDKKVENMQVIELGKRAQKKQGE